MAKFGIHDRDQCPCCIRIEVKLLAAGAIQLLARTTKVCVEEMRDHPVRFLTLRQLGLIPESVRQALKDE